MNEFKLSLEDIKQLHDKLIKIRYEKLKPFNTFNEDYILKECKADLESYNYKVKIQEEVSNYFDGVIENDELIRWERLTHRIKLIFS